MMQVIATVVSIWRTAANVVRRRPLPFALAAAGLAATDLMLWRVGMLDAATRAGADRAMVLTFVFTKLVILLAWLLASLRLADDPQRTGLLGLNRRQLGWLAALFLLLPVLLGVRFLLVRAATPLSPDPLVGLLVGTAVYMAIVVGVQVKLMPALTGVLLGDAGATLAWSWRATSGLVLSFIAALWIGIAPLFILHVGNSLVWLPADTVARLIVLLFDGAVMAALVLVSAAAYVWLYRAARARSAASD